jgi:tetratricopeptide (TPR) repeat protein/transcriptional regulator with XRE-family HTH domain
MTVTPDTDLPSFGTLLKAYRKRRRLTQQQLADAVGMHRHAVGRWEQGDFLPASKTIVLELARQLRLDTTETRALLEASLTALSPHWSVPLPRNPFFTGREQILETVHRQLGGSTAVALTQSSALSGMGGVGKTQIALEYAYGHALDYSAVFWIGAETVESIISSLLRIAEVLQLPQRDDQDQQRVLAAVGRWLTTHHDWLLIWDNLEDFELLARFLPSTRPGAILITTRCQALGTLAHGIDLEPMGEEESVMLLLRRAKLVGPQATADEVQHVTMEKPAVYAVAQQLVTKLGRLPLALDQAGAYIEETGCGLVEYVQRYSQKRQLLLDRRGLASDHPLSVVATIRLACQRVAEQQPAAVELLRCCAFLYADAIPEELLLAGVDYLGPVLGPVVADATAFDLALATLRKYSLVQRNPDTRMLSLHRLVQVIVQEELSEQEQAQWRQRLIRLLSDVFPTIPPETTVELWEQCERLLPHVMTSIVTKPEHLQNQDLAEVLFKASRYLFQRSRYDQGSLLCQRALLLFEQTLGPQYPQVALALYTLAGFYRQQGKYEQAEPLYERALQIREQALGPLHPDVAASLNNLAFVYRERGKYEQAEPLYERALQIREQALGPLHPNVAFSLNGLAILYRDIGKIDRAELFFRQSVQILEQALGPDHPDVARPLNNLADLYREQGKYEQAEPLAERAVNLFEQALGPEHPLASMALSTLAELYREQGRYELAQPIYQRVLRLLEQTLGADHPQMAYPLEGLANLLREQGEYAEAASRYKRALSVREQHLGQHHPETAQTVHELAILHQHQGNLREACALAERALAIHVQSLGETHPKTIAVRTLYTHLVQEQGRSPEEEPACGQPADPPALAGGEEHLTVQVMRVAVRGAGGQVAYTRLVPIRDVTFTCTVCGQTVTQQHPPSGRIKYCSDACRAIGAAQRQQVRVARQREQRRIARGARLPAQQGNGL